MNFVHSETNFEYFFGEDQGRYILEISKELEVLISQNKPISVIEEQALKEGLTELLISGLDSIKNGETSLEEVLKVASD